MGRAPAVLVVEDNAFVLDATTSLLKAHGYSVDPSSDPAAALDKVSRNTYDAVVSDIRMPGMSGLVLLGRVREADPDLPVILMTAYAELDTAVEALHRGAFDFIIKPYKPDYLLHTLEKAVNYRRLVEMEKNYKKQLEEDVRLRTRELAEAMETIKEMSSEMMVRLVAVAEYRDPDTGAHIRRMGLYAGELASALGLGGGLAESMRFASPMHDIGKIGIPDNILLKAGPLTVMEMEVMKTHTTIGGRMLAGSRYGSLQLAASIAVHHHERYDGTGYPRGLKGEDIPVEGRIVIIADQYDALRSRRPYKGPLTHEEACGIILKGDGRTMPGHFDPVVLEAFRTSSGKFDEIFMSYQDQPLDNDMPGSIFNSRGR